MDIINNVIWDLEPHTKAKHEILRYYLGAWFPILAKSCRRILYIDGFAGPGEYKYGEHGSPIIALNVAKNHVLRNIVLRQGTELVFYFIEKDEPRYFNLKKRIDELELPSNFKIKIECETFEHSFGQVITSIEEQSKQLAPSFIFIDPFGPTGFPMSLIKRISKQPRSEVLITFNYQSLNQWFLSDSSKHARLDELYGNNAWRQFLQIPIPSDREKRLMEAYKDELENFGWKVRPFRMINKHNQTQYYLFFATSNWLGMLVMKQAMWNAAPTGDFKYSDLTDPRQICMFETIFDDVYSQELSKQIHQNYKGDTIQKQDLIKNYLAWHPTCIERHLTKALRLLEYDESPPKIIGVELPDRNRRKGTYPEDCFITFAP